MTRSAFFFLLVVIMVACTVRQTEFPENVITYRSIENHILALSSDSMKGRMPGTSSEELAIGYIAQQMKKIGLEPASSGSFPGGSPVACNRKELTQP